MAEAIGQSLAMAIEVAISPHPGHRRGPHPHHAARLGLWLNNAIMSVLCLVIAAKLVSDAVPHLAG